MTFGIKYKSYQLGYEIELESPAYIDKKIAKENNISFKEFSESELIPGIQIKLSEEYYPETTEFNFFKCNPTISNNQKIISFVKHMIKKYELKIVGPSPRFVGYHIHIFRTSLLSIPNITDIVLKKTLSYILTKIDTLSTESLQRLISSHQLWGYYVVNIDNNIHKILRQLTNLDFSYLQTAASKRKYQPVILSERSRVGKMQSLEIRALPTEFLINNDTLDFIKYIHNDEKIEDSVVSLYKKLVEVYASRVPRVQKSDFIPPTLAESLRSSRDYVTMSDIEPDEDPDEYDYDEYEEEDETENIREDHPF